MCECAAGAEGGGADKSQRSHSEVISYWFACPSTVPPLSQQPNRLMMHLEVALRGVYTAERCVSRSAPMRKRPIAREPILHYTRRPHTTKLLSDERHRNSKKRWREGRSYLFLFFAKHRKKR